MAEYIQNSGPHPAGHPIYGSTGTFRALANSTIRINANTGVSPVQLPNAPAGSYQIRVKNKGTADAYIQDGPSTITTAVPTTTVAGGQGVAAGATEVFTVEGSYLAVIGSSTPDIEVTVGYGQ